jgi:hypothetical protein
LIYSLYIRGGVGTSGRREVAGKMGWEGEYSANCLHMYVNTKGYLFKLFQESREGEIKESGVGDECKYDIFDTL